MAYKKKHAVIMEKKSDTAVRECKAVRFNVESVDEESGEFSGHAAVFDNVDDGGDIIEPGAFSRRSRRTLTASKSFHNTTIVTCL